MTRDPHAPDIYHDDGRPWFPDSLPFYGVIGIETLQPFEVLAFCCQTKPAHVPTADFTWATQPCFDKIHLPNDIHFVLMRMIEFGGCVAVRGCTQRHAAAGYKFLTQMVGGYRA